MFVSLQISHVEILTPSDMVLGSWAFRKGLGNEGEMEGVGALIKEKSKRSLTPSTKWGHSEMMAF